MGARADQIRPPRVGWQAVSNPEIVSKVNALVTAARADGDLVVWILHAESW